LQIAAGWIRHFGASRILDIGCGEGQLLATLDPTVIDSYIGIDASSVATARAIRRPGVFSQFRTIEIQSEDIPSDISADCICCIDVLCYFDNPAEVLRKLFRTLSPGGFAIVCQWVEPPQKLRWLRRSHYNIKTEAIWSIIDEFTDTTLDVVQLTNGINKYVWNLKAFRPRPFD
jgi:SAM-dependent methyltransferase